MNSIRLSPPTAAQVVTGPSAPSSASSERVRRVTSLPSYLAHSGRGRVCDESLSPDVTGVLQIATATEASHGAGISPSRVKKLIRYDREVAPDVSGLESSLVSLQVIKATLVTLGPESFMSRVHYSPLPETWWISQYPKDSEAHWEWICSGNISLGIQLAESSRKFPSYQLALGESRSFSSHLVELEGLDETQGFFHRSYKIIDLTSSATRRFDHFELPWVNFSIPDLISTKALLQAYQAVVSLCEEPQVHVHCLGGKGRSGTFVLARCMTRLGVEKVDEILEGLRAQRHHLVENEQQKLFAQHVASLF